MTDVGGTDLVFWTECLASGTFFDTRIQVSNVAAPWAALERSALIWAGRDAFDRLVADRRLISEARTDIIGVQRSAAEGR
ncbi:MAG: hypothetical protein AVDCRST_MAG39-814 [uncultured Sphingomonadaceae bacterium]|uniref:Uncharacterized protein n=1 Tax=uncultured Sphingomonadaceae bacterium TaxID=169976 RepID=A0A6J4SET2_9SPHN|nr:MAG: hypothetical protein AVDCRST_MAG39-814 [uncultured Sphingomonadaceae bacterium]